MAIALTLSYNLGHNILELYNILVQVRFTTSKTKLDIWYSKLSIRVASRVAEQRPLGGGGGPLCPHKKKKRLGSQEIRKYQRNLKFGWTHISAPRPPSQQQNSAIALTKHGKADTKLLFPRPALPDLSIPLQIPCPGLQLAWPESTFRIDDFD